MNPFPPQASASSSSRIVIVNCPIGLAPSGTIGNASDSNLLVLGTALTQILPAAYMYFPANAVESGSAAGFYYVEMSSTTNGQVYANRYLAAPDELPVIPSSPTAPTTGYSSATAYTGQSSTISDVLQITITAGELGNNGWVRHSFHNVMSNTANAKGLGINFDGNGIGGWVGVTSKSSNSQIGVFFNTQSESTQMALTNQTVSASSDQLNYLTVDTTAAAILSVDLRVTNATDYSFLQNAIFEIHGS